MKDLLTLLIFSLSCVSANATEILDTDRKVALKVGQGEIGALIASLDKKVTKTESNDPFLNAIISGDLNAVRELIEKGESVDKHFSYDQFIFLALSNLFSNTSISTLSNFGLRSYNRFIRPVIDTNYQATPLMVAAGFGELEIVKELIKAGAQVDLGGELSININLEGGFFDENVTIHNFLNPLIVASIHGYREVVSELIEADADVNTVASFSDDDSGEGFYLTPLLAATLRGNLSITQELLRAGANVDQTVAVFKEYTEHKTFSSSSTVTEKGEQHDEPVLEDEFLTVSTTSIPLITVAAITRNDAVIRELIKAGANINDNGGVVSLHDLFNDFDVGSENDDLQEKMSDFSLPLFAAITYGYPQTVRALCEAGVKLNDTLKQAYITLSASIATLDMPSDGYEEESEEIKMLNETFSKIMEEHVPRMVENIRVMAETCQGS